MLNKKVGLVALLASLSAADLFGATLTNYTIGDVLLCFRKSGITNDMVVDLGPVATFTNAAANQRINLTQYTGNQLALIGTNNLIWSVFTWYDQTATPANIQWTLFSSNPRASLNSQSSPIPQASQSSQHQAGNQMASVPKGAFDNLVTTNYNALNTTNAVLEPDNNNNSNYKTGRSYSDVIGGNLNFNDTFSGTPESTTPPNFTTAGNVQRSDFYWLPPSSVAGVPTGFNEVFLGYFELNTNGVMTYVAYPAAQPTVPVIQSITRTNNITYVKFTTGPSGTYTLRGANVLGGTAPTNWPAITSTAGNGSPNTLQDTTSVPNKFYVITAQ